MRLRSRCVLRLRNVRCMKSVLCVRRLQLARLVGARRNEGGKHMPVSLVLLAIIVLVLYILFGYLIPEPTTPPRGPYFRPIVAVIVIILVLLFWFVLPLRVG